MGEVTAAAAGSWAGGAGAAAGAWLAAAWPQVQRLQENWQKGWPIQLSEHCSGWRKVCSACVRDKALQCAGAQHSKHAALRCTAQSRAHTPAHLAPRCLLGTEEVSRGRDVGAEAYAWAVAPAARDLAVPA